MVRVPGFYTNQFVPLRGLFSAGPREADVIYALFMLLVLLTIIAAWHRHVLELPLFAITVVWVLVHLVGDMTTPLTLSF